MPAFRVELWLSHGCHIFMSHCRSFSMLMSVASSLLLPSCLGHYSVFSEFSESFCVFWVSYALCASIYAISTLSPSSIFSTVIEVARGEWEKQRKIWEKQRKTKSRGNHWCTERYRYTGWTYRRPRHIWSDWHAAVTRGALHIIGRGHSIYKASLHPKELPGEELAEG